MARQRRGSQVHVQGAGAGRREQGGRAARRLQKRGPAAAEPAAPEHSPADGDGGQAAAAVSAGVSTKAIVAFTQSGATARLISKRRPRTPIIAFTPSERIWRQLCLCWGTEPRLIAQIEETDRMVAEVEARLLLEGSVRVGDTLVILAGAPITAKAETNLLKLHRVGGE